MLNLVLCYEAFTPTPTPTTPPTHTRHRNDYTGRRSSGNLAHVYADSDDHEYADRDADRHADRHNAHRHTDNHSNADAQDTPTGMTPGRRAFGFSWDWSKGGCNGTDLAEELSARRARRRGRDAYRSLPELLEDSLRRYAERGRLHLHGARPDLRRARRQSAAFGGGCRAAGAAGSRVAIMLPERAAVPVALAGALRAGYWS